MRTRKVPATDLRGPEDVGPYIKKGSLVLREGLAWRVQSLRAPHAGLMEIDVQQERPTVKGREELTSPTSARWSVRDAEKFDLVIESNELDLQQLGRTEVYGFDVSADDEALATEVFRFLGAWLDGEGSLPLHVLTPPSDRAFEFRVELTSDGHLLFGKALDRVRKYKGRVGLRIFEGPSRSTSLPA